jgi:amino acid transporter
MSTTEDRADKIAPQDFAGGQRVFLRNATGLVRSASGFDMWVFSISGSTVIPFAVGLFWAYTIWPRTNFLLALLMGGVLCSFTWICWSLLAATMPRTGGGYIFNSRILHPAIGFSADVVGMLVQSTLSMAIWTTWFTNVALASAFGSFGSLHHNDTLSRWAVDVTKPSWTFWLGTALSIAVFGVAAWGLKKSLRAQHITFWISTGGLIVSILILLFTGRASFIHHFNNYANQYTHQSNSYTYIVDQAHKKGFSSGGHTFSDTFGSIFVVLTVSVWAWASTYLAGELRGARSVGKQFRVIVTSGAFNILLFLVATAVFFHAAGEEFFASANYLNTIGANPLPAPPFYTLLTGVMVANPVLSGIIVFSFVFNVWCGLWNLIGEETRALFAYSFDGVMPRKLATVNPRTHTPIYALAIFLAGAIGVTYWAAYRPNGFFSLWAEVGLFAFVMMTVTAISAIVLPWRRKADYEASPAKFEILGIPAVSIAGAASLITCGVFFYLVFKYPSVLGTASLKSAWLAVGITAAAGFLWFYAAKWLRRREGMRLEAAFAEIPPE